MGIYLNKIRRKVGFNYERNIALRLILSLGGFYIGLHALYIIIMVLADNQKIVFNGYYLPGVGLQSFEVFMQKPWIILSHFLYTQGFFEFVTNMVWLYLFSAIIQTLVGYKEILPIFLISSILAAFGLMGINEVVGFAPYIITGCYAGVIAMGTACVVLAPNYKMYFTQSIAVPVWILFTIFLVLNAVVFVPANVPMLILLGFGALVGAVYMLLLKGGFSIGKSLYHVLGKMETSIGKNNSINHEEVSASKLVLNKKNDNIDALLEKIHQKGYLSLTAKEKDELENFSNSL